MKQKDEMPESDETAPPAADRTPEVLSFRAVIVMTHHAGGKPLLSDVETALIKSNLKFVMPADPSGMIVISLNDVQ